MNLDQQVNQVFQGNKVFKDPKAVQEKEDCPGRVALKEKQVNLVQQVALVQLDNQDLLENLVK